MKLAIAQRNYDRQEPKLVIVADVFESVKKDIRDESSIYFYAEKHNIAEALYETFKDDAPEIDAKMSAALTTQDYAEIGKLIEKIVVEYWTNHLCFVRGI